MADKFGIDISRAQSDFNMADAVNNYGVEFVIIKAGGSDDGIYMDSQFVNNYNKAKALGIPVGIYWYTKALSVSALDTEISYLMSNITGMQFELPIYLDLEEQDIYSVAGDLGERWIRSLLNQRYYPGIYSMYSWFYDNLDRNIFSTYPIWLAYWIESKPTFKWNFGVWQKGAEQIAGVLTDIDYMYDDYSFIQQQGYNGYSGSPSYTIRRTSPAGSGSPFYNTISVGGYNTSIVGHGAISGANVLNNCVGYSQGRMMEMYSEAISPITSASENIFSMFNANAEEWYDIAIANGFPVGQVPTYGAVGVWYNGAGIGHVANVEDYQNGVWEISEGHYNYGGEYGSWDYSYLQNNSDYLPAFIGADYSWYLIGFIYPFTVTPPTPPTPPAKTRKLKPWMMLRNPTLY